MAATPSRGTWELGAAIIAQWREERIDDQFRAYWPTSDQSASSPPTLNEGEARPDQPGPYCIYNILPGFKTGETTGDTSTEQVVYYDVPVRFEIRAKSNNGKSGKTIAAALAAEVARAFDPDMQLIMNNDCHTQTRRDDDLVIREGDEEWAIVLQYTFSIEARLPDGFDPSAT